MGCTTCGVETPDGSIQCPDCARQAAECWREAHRAKPRPAHAGSDHAHEHRWWQRRLSESRGARAEGAPGLGAVYVLAAQAREVRAHEGVTWGSILLLAVGSVGVARVAFGAGAVEQTLWALAALAVGVMGAEFVGGRESAFRMLVVGPIGLFLVGAIVLAVESGAASLALALPLLTVVAGVAVHLTIRRRRRAEIGPPS